MSYLDQVNLSSYTFDLGIERKDQLWQVSGQLLYVFSVDGEIYVKVNDQNSALIDLRIARIIRIPFERLYLTNPAQTGKNCVIVISNILTIPEPVTLSNNVTLANPTDNIYITTDELYRLTLTNSTKDAIAKAHTQNTDTALAPLTANINANSYKITNLGVPTSIGDSIRVTSIITEANLEDAINKKHTQNTDTALAPLTADINANSHKITSLSAPVSAGDSVRATTIITESNLEDAVNKRHTQNTDTALAPLTQDLDLNSHKILNTIGTFSIKGTQTEGSFGSELVGNGSFSTVPDTSWTWGTTWKQDTTNYYATHTASTGGVAQVLIDDGGSGYVVNDVLTIASGNNDCTLTVTSVSSGKVTGLSITTAGSGYSEGGGLSITGGTGTGCKVTIARIEDDSQTLSQSIAISSGNIYQVSWSVKNRTTGWVKVTIGGYTSTYFNTSSSFVFTASNTNALTFVATKNFNGSIDDVSVKQITPATVTQSLLNASGSIGVELRSGGNILNNTAIGVSSLYSNTTGSYNTAIGVNSFYSNTTGNFNTAIGYDSLYSNSTGSYNTAIGANSLLSNTTGRYNTAIGYNALYSNTTGNFNIAIGYYPLYFNTSGNGGNVAIGYYPLYATTTGFYNVAIGYSPLQNNTTGYGNTAIGYISLYSNTTGNLNTAIGAKSLYSNTTGNYNTAIGYQAGYNLTSGNQNLIIGYNINFPNSTGSYQLNIGNAIFGTNIDGTGTTISSGNIGLFTNSPTAKLDINANTIRLRTARTITKSTDTGNQGDICWDSNYLYICVATNTWKRVALSSW